MNQTNARCNYHASYLPVRSTVSRARAQDLDPSSCATYIPVILSSPRSHAASRHVARLRQGPIRSHRQNELDPDEADARCMRAQRKPHRRIERHNARHRRLSCTRRSMHTRRTTSRTTNDEREERSPAERESRAARGYADRHMRTRRRVQVGWTGATSMLSRD